MITPVRRPWVPVLRFVLWAGRYVPLAQRSILQFDFIHFVRWSVIRRLPGERRQRYRYLFFESNFDGPWQHYIDAFAYVIPRGIRLVWGRGPAFPAPPPSEPLKAWIARNSLEGGHYYCAYPEASTRMVKAALAVARAFPALAAGAAQHSSAFPAAFERFLDEQQAHL